MSYDEAVVHEAMQLAFRRGFIKGALHYGDKLSKENPALRVSIRQEQRQLRETFIELEKLELEELLK